MLDYLHFGLIVFAAFSLSAILWGLLVYTIGKDIK